MRSLYSVIDVIKYLHKDNDLTIHFITSKLSGSESILCTLAGKFASHFLCLINLPPSSTNWEKSLYVWSTYLTVELWYPPCNMMISVLRARVRIVSGQYCKLQLLYCYFVLCNRPNRTELSKKNQRQRQLAKAKSILLVVCGNLSEIEPQARPFWGWRVLVRGRNIISRVRNWYWKNEHPLQDSSWMDSSRDIHWLLLT